MGSIASINFKPTNNIQLHHNDRTIPPTYLLAKELGYGCECDRSGDDALALRHELITQAIERYRRTFNQPFKSESYLWSAVVNLKPDSTMQDLERLANHFKTKYGFQCYQIAIHRDEGHVDDEDKVQINHHAHMEFVMLDELTGKNVFRTIKHKHLREIQSEVAEILGMQRGVDKRISKVKRVEPRAYAQLMEKSKAERKHLKARWRFADERHKHEYKIIQTTYASLCKLLEVKHNKPLTMKSLKEVSYIEQLNMITKAHLEAIENKIKNLKQEKLEAENALIQFTEKNRTPLLKVFVKHGKPCKP
ncbi:hypothetical protein [Helicobacter felis]|uniref:hypothetical protein n=1 Tax=Helicobacter felis TaxID=214 RepID=UPI0018F85C3C|nr:hypothetical protein [Helicobacter felis]